MTKQLLFDAIHELSGIGFGLPALETIPYIPDEEIGFWGGWGGSIVVVDQDGTEVFRNAGAERFRNARHVEAIVDKLLS